jgi:hypothetical protein
MAEVFFQLPAAPSVTHPETKPATRLSIVETAADFADFQRVPEHVYWGDPFHITPIKSIERAGFDRAKQPFFKHGDARLWTAWHGHGQPVGRIAAFIDRHYDEATKKRWGFFGFLEYMNDARLPEALLAEAVAWLRGQGAEEIAGPVLFSPACQRRGMQVDGFYDDPVYISTYNPPSYPGYLVRLGLEKWFDEYGYTLDTTAPPPEKLLARAREITSRDGLKVRPLDLERLDAEWDVVRDLTRKACAAQPRFVQLPYDDVHAGAHALLPVIRLFPEGALILEERGEPAGFAIALPDWNRVLKHLGGSLFPLGWLKAMLLKRTIDRIRVLSMAVVGEGRARALPLVAALWSAIHARGYRSAELLPLAEDNARALKLVEGIGAKRTRAWRVYKVPATFAGTTTPARGA